MTRPLPVPAGSPNAQIDPNPVMLYPSLEGHDRLRSPLIAYWQIVMRWRFHIVAIMSAFLLLGILISIFSDREYAAGARIQVDRVAAKVLDMDSVEGDQNVHNWEFYKTQYQLLESRTLAEAVVTDLSLDTNDHFLSGGDADVAEGLADVSSEDRFAWATDLVRGGTSVRPVLDSSIIDIIYTSHDPQLSADVANALAHSFITRNLERRYEASGYAREFLSERLEQTRAKLEESEEAAAAYARREGIVTTTGTSEEVAGGRQTIAASQLERLSNELASATAARVAAESEYRANRGGSAAATGLNNLTLNGLREQRGKLVGELSNLTSDFGPEYPKVVALQSQLDELAAQISREEDRVARSVDQDLADRYEKARSTEDSLRARVESAKEDVLAQQQDSIRFNILQRDVQTNRELYEALLQRYKQIGVAAGIGTNNVSIVDEALAPAGPSSPRIFLIMASMLLLGLGTSGGAVLLLHQLSQARLSPDDLPSKLGLPLLGSTPNVPEFEKGETTSAELSEAYFSTLTALQFSTTDGAPPAILVTSSQKGEGKSTTAFALADDLASLDQKVLLIDGDMRSPSVHRQFDLPLGKGLSDCLSGRATLDELVHRDVGENKMSTLLAGMPPPNPAELLAGPKMRMLIDEALKTFDYVVIDGPPVLGLADAPLLSRHADGTVFVVESHRTPAPRAKAALDRLHAVQARLIGAVITKYDERTGSYGYGYGYGVGSRYRYSDK